MKVKKPEIRVGISNGMTGEPEFHGAFHSRPVPEGTLYTPDNPGDAYFTLPDVRIGIGFHWEQEEKQSFRGSLELTRTPQGIRAVNIIDIEDYLKSVISSEMNSRAYTEFLKAHAVISRSWVLRRIGWRLGGNIPADYASGGKLPGKEKKNVATSSENRQMEREERIVRWYDMDGHDGFDVCADDHCQRYQGITRISSHNALQAVEETEGEVLAFAGKICDTRFSKCCGGITETFETCWADTPHPYLKSKPDPFCGEATPETLSRVLNSYDLDTRDYYRWEADYDIGELSGIIRERSGIDIGEVQDLIPLERGGSGRIKLLRIVGTRRTIDIGKELEIRKWLSRSHLYSSAFNIRKRPRGFLLEGFGWGHGVGLCQIGAAVMADKGYGYREILSHYYPGAELVKAGY